MRTTRRGFLWVVLGIGAAACSDGGIVNVRGDDASAGTDSGGADAGMLADATSDSPADASTARIFVGAVTGSDAQVAIVVEGPKAFLFFCGGAMTYSTHTKWFRGDASLAAPFTLVQTGWTATGALQTDGTTINGTLDRAMDGEAPLAWTATSVNPATAAGLYEETDADGTAALIVTQPTASDTPVLQGAFKTPNGLVQQVVTLVPITDGFKGDVTVNGTTKEITLLRAHPH